MKNLLAKILKNSVSLIVTISPASLGFSGVEELPESLKKLR
ncbi:hypothetical protein [uncultured Clostridium sp.]|nr:hypothetical protein [uncultured Clostridium sp.]